MNYIRVSVWVGVLAGLLSFPSFGKALDEEVSQQVQQSVDETQFVDVNAGWEVAVVERGHFQVKTVKYVCPGVLATTAVLVPTPCVLPHNSQGIQTSPTNRLLQHLSLISAQGNEKKLRTEFKQLHAWYTAVGSMHPFGQEGRIYTTWEEGASVISTYEDGIAEDGKVFVYGGRFESATQDPHLKLRNVYFQSKAGGNKIKLSPQYVHKNGWTVLSVAGK